jgi:hypothetical protein
MSKRKATETWDPIEVETRMLEREQYLQQLFVPVIPQLQRLPIRWLIQDLIPEGCLSLLVAEPKEGKTSLATAIALSVATGTPFAGCNVEQSSVLWLSAEESMRERNFLLDQSPFVDSTLPLYTCYQPLAIDDEEALDALQYWVMETDAKFVVVDPLIAATSGRSLRDGWNARRSLQALKRFCDRMHVAALVLHHRKDARHGLARSRAAENDQLSATASLVMSMKVRKLEEQEWMSREHLNLRHPDREPRQVKKLGVLEEDVDLRHPDREPRQVKKLGVLEEDVDPRHPDREPRQAKKPGVLEEDVDPRHPERESAYTPGPSECSTQRSRGTSPTCNTSAHSSSQLQTPNSKLQTPNFPPPRLIALELSGRGDFANQTLWLLSNGPLDYVPVHEPLPLDEGPQIQLGIVENAIMEALYMGTKDSGQLLDDVQCSRIGTLRNALTRLRRKRLIVVRTRQDGTRRYGLTPEGRTLVTEQMCGENKASVLNDSPKPSSKRAAKRKQTSRAEVPKPA